MQRYRLDGGALVPDPEGAWVLYDALLEQERGRCIGLVQLAREGEIDGDLRSIIHRIKHGDTAEKIMKERE